MKFDRRKFFESIAGGASGLVLAKDLGASTAVSKLGAVPQPSVPPLIFDRVPYVWYDTIQQPAGPGRYLYEAFQVPLHQLDAITSERKTYLDTNMYGFGCFTAPFDAVVNRLGFLFAPEMSDQDIEWASRYGRYEFIVGEKIIYRGTLEWAAAGPDRGKVLDREAKFIAHGAEYIPPELYFVLRVMFESSVVKWASPFRLLCLLDCVSAWPVA